MLCSRKTVESKAMREESTEIREREQRWGQVLVACLEALENEPAPDRQGLLAHYPKFAAELEEFFAQREHVGQAVSPLGAVVREPGALPRSFGDYEFLDEIGQGGMGVVYKARQKSLNRLVALKMIRAGGFEQRQRHLYRHHQGSGPGQPALGHFRRLCRLRSGWLARPGSC
jgi:hypothetical protein